MAIEEAKLSLERYAYQLFMAKWKKGDFKGQRLGQAFHNHFRLDRLVDQDVLLNLYNKDGDDATYVIKRVFKFN